MKLRKILLVLIVMVLGVSVVKANNSDERTKITTTYPYYENVYRMIGAISYYHDRSASFDGTETKSAEDVWTDAMTKFGTLDKSNVLKTAYNDLRNSTPGSNNSQEFVRAIMAASGLDNICTTTNEATTEAWCEQAKRSRDAYRDQLASFESLASMFKYAKNTLSGMVNNYKKLAAQDKMEVDSSFISRYENTITATIETYTNFCDKLKDSPGIAYYLNMALRLVSYAALALAVILGALDFTKAITSQDDAALTKAFQSFVKRLVAVALIFMTYVIVQLVMGLVDSIPNYEASNSEICEELKIGGLKGF